MTEMVLGSSRMPIVPSFLASTALQNPATSYNAHPIWQDINNCFPSNFRIPDNQQPVELSFEWRGCSIHVDRYASARSPVRLILHHGLGTNARLMTIILGHGLHRMGYDVSAIDMPYVGATRTPRDDFSYGDWVQLSSDFIDYGNGPDHRPVVLFGFSVGGMLSFDVSCLNHRVIGVCGTCFIDLRDRSVRTEIASSPTWNSTMERLSDLMLGMGVRPRIPLQTFASRRTISNKQRLNGLLAKDRSSLGGRFPLTFLSSLRTYQGAVSPELYDFCPVALLQCERDRNIPHQINRRFFDRIAGRKHFELIEDAGHIPTGSQSLRSLLHAVHRFVTAVS